MNKTTRTSHVVVDGTPLPSTASGHDTPAIRLNNVHVAWDTSLILHGITLAIPHGQTVAITGANGSGKSTLMRALMGTAPITHGDIKLFGQPLNTPRSIPWHRIGYVPQRFNSGGGISSTVEEVVRSGLLGPRRFFARPGDHKKALEQLERVGLRHRANDPISILSGGQQQRALIARALIRQPDLLIMDEPMAGIDAHSRQRLAQLLTQAQEQGTTILLVLHELGELADLLDRELHIQNGHISYDGPVDNADEHPHTHENHPHHPDTTDEGFLSRRHRYSAQTVTDILPGGHHD